MAEFKKENVTPGVKSAVNACLMAQAYAETLREAVDEISRAILQECPLTDDLIAKHENRATKPITNPQNVYLCENEDALEDYYLERNKRIKAAGLKPKDMPEDHCPALVAEDIHRTAKRLLVECAVEAFKMGDDFAENLSYASIEHYNQFIDLIIGLVVQDPDFKNPLTGKRVG